MTTLAGLEKLPREEVVARQLEAHDPRSEMLRQMKEQEVSLPPGVTMRDLQTQRRSVAGAVVENENLVYVVYRVMPPDDRQFADVISVRRDGRAWRLSPDREREPLFGDSSWAVYIHTPEETKELEQAARRTVEWTTDDGTRCSLRMHDSEDGLRPAFLLVQCQAPNGAARRIEIPAARFRDLLDIVGWFAHSTGTTEEAET